MPQPTPMPPDPDLNAQRGTDLYRDLVRQRHQWVAHNYLRGVPLEDLVEKYGDDGNFHHDWKEWNDWGGGFHKPAEYAEEEWKIGNFRRQIAAGDFTEWPPGSGKFFNDPANDTGARQWFNQYGDPINPPDDPGPNIDYGLVNEEYGGSINNYLKGEAKRAEDEAKAKPKEMPKPTPAPTNLPSGEAPLPGNNPQQQPNKPATDSYSMGALMGGSDMTTVPGRFQTSPAFSGNVRKSPFMGNQPSRVPRNPTGNQRKIGQGWYSNWG